MNILHLLSQTHLTGSEVFANSLIDNQTVDNNCFIISDTINIETKAEYHAMQIHNRNIFSRIHNLIKLFIFCKKKNIDLIHTHSRAASWLAYFVTKWLKIAYVSTVHGVQGIHFSSKRKNIYGKNITVVCEFLKDHLINDLNINSEYISVVRNGLKIAVKNTTKPKNKKIVWIGRLTGPKGELAKLLVQKVFSYLEDIEFDLIGGPNELLTEFKNIAPNNCHFLGQIDNAAEKIAGYDIVFGSGRVALEAMANNKPIFAIGEAESIGFVNDLTIYKAKYSNFGDCGTRSPKDFDFKLIYAQLIKYLSINNKEQFDDYLLEYNLDTISKKIMNVYKKAQC